MSEPLPPSTGDENYQPLSGFALAGLFVSAGFAVLVLFVAAVAVGFGSPIFFPVWILLTPVAGFALAMVGRNQIVGSEGTKAGLRIANWGMVLALFSGLGYAAYYFAVGMAVTSQANTFLVGDPDGERGFFKHLARGGNSPGDVDIAFLLTKPAAGRIKLRPGESDKLTAAYDQPTPDGGVGELSRFRSLAFVRMLAMAGDQAVVTPLGLRDWSHEKSSYKVARNYEIKTPEATLELVVQAESTEPEAEGQMRQWFVNMQQMQMKGRSLTPLGQAIEALREQAYRFADVEFRDLVAAGKPFCDKVDVATADKTDWKAVVPDTAEQAKTGKNLNRAFYQAQIKSLLEGHVKSPFHVAADSNSWPVWKLDGQGRMSMDVPIQLMIPGGREALPASAQGRLRVRTTAPVDPAKTSSPPSRVGWEAEEFAIERLRPIRGAQ